jgi:PadR family transcriptional regulator, regulatory protein AphA
MRVKTLCLGALCLGDATGYDIKKLFEAAFNHFHGASFGSIYPSLQQLEHEGLVSHSIEAGDRHPDRKLFHVTDAGRAAFASELAGTPATEQLRSEFLVLMFFAHLLPGEVLRQKLDDMQSHYRGMLDYLDSIAACSGHTAGMEFTIGMGQAVVRAKLEYLLSQREALLAAHRRPTSKAACAAAEMQPEAGS